MSGPNMIEAEQRGLCQMCLARAETRPYGPKGEEVCFKCGMKDEEAAEKQYGIYVHGDKP